MPWTILDFGKHSGKSLPQVILSDPDYFYWAMDKGVFNTRPLLRKEAEKIERRAAAIKIPNDSKKENEIEYILHPPSMTLCSFEVVPSSRPLHKGGSPAFRETTLSLKAPYNFKSYDKLGYKIFLKSFKTYILQRSSIRITRQVAEDFFSNTRNFQNP